MRLPLVFVARLRYYLHPVVRWMSVLVAFRRWLLALAWLDFGIGRLLAVAVG
jgi:hypothetical protein